MKNIFNIFVIFCLFGTTYAQQDLINEIQKQAIRIDSLEKSIAVDKGSSLQQIESIQKNLKLVRDTLKKQQLELSELKIFKKEKNTVDAQMQQKRDSISFLKASLKKKERQIVDEKQKSEQNGKDEKRKGREEILNIIVQNYKNSTFDELVISSSLLTVRRDLSILGTSYKDTQVISDLEKYFRAQDVLTKRYDPAQAKIALNLLIQIKQKSTSIENLKEKIDNYSLLSEGLKGTISNLITLDDREEAGKEDKIKKLKLNKVINQISLYIFNYNFNFSDYPYLSEILLEVFKRKQPNPDAVISDLLEKL